APAVGGAAAWGAPPQLDDFRNPAAHQVLRADPAKDRGRRAGDRDFFLDEAAVAATRGEPQHHRQSQGNGKTYLNDPSQETHASSRRGNAKRVGKHLSPANASLQVNLA